MKNDDAYSGDLTAQEAWEKVLGTDAVLVDIRTEGEWQHIGVPKLDQLTDTSSGGTVSPHPVIFSSWVFADGSVNPDFLADLTPFRNRDLVLICRSGRRSVDAAIALGSAGFHAFNVLGGFEAPGGWRDSALPWRTGWTRESANSASTLTGAAPASHGAESRQGVQE